jgi:hypothetical protein
LERSIEETQKKIDKHIKGIERGSRVEQRKKWLGQARAELQTLQKQLAKAKGGVEAVDDAAKRYETHKSPTVTFEKKFQALMKEALKDMSRQQIMDQVLTTLTQFNNSLAKTEAEGARVAAMGDVIGRWLTQAWKKMKALFGAVTKWIKGLFVTAKDLNRLMDKAEAKR